MLELRTVQCPYCGESFDSDVDTSGGSQEYIEDCQICCQPIVFRLTVDTNGELLTLDTQRDND